MKKVLFSLLLIVGLSTVSFAQIQIEESYSNDLIIIGNISDGAAFTAISMFGSSPQHYAEHKVYCRIFKDKTTFGILVDTESTVDDDFEFALGTDISKARESIKLILGFMDKNPIGKSIEVKDEDGRTIQIHIVKKNRIMLKVLDGTEILYNNIYLTKNHLMRADSLIENDAMKKVEKALKKNRKHIE